MEVARGDDLAVLDEDERVVARAVQLGLERRCEELERRCEAAVHLAHAAERERILYATAARGGERAAGEERTQPGGAGRLAGRGPGRDHPLVERREVGAEALAGECRGGL